MADRCQGHCCRIFYLPYSPAELRQSYEVWQHESGVTMIKKGGFKESGIVRSGPGVLMDIHLIFPMVRYLGFMVPPEGCFIEKRETKAHYYTCVHFKPSPDGQGGDCGIYDYRPAMCRTYPYGSRCQYQDCTWDEVAASKAPPDPEPDLEKLAEKCVEFEDKEG